MKTISSWYKYCHHVVAENVAPRIGIRLALVIGPLAQTSIRRRLGPK